MLKAKIKVGAKFKFLTRKKNGDISTETNWFNNLVLDAGLDAMGGGGTADISHVWIGTGNSTPITTQTSLDNTLAGTSTISGGDESGLQTSESPVYYWIRRTFRFALGVAAGNLAEVGLGNNLKILFNRALIKDGLGNPTTVTVLSDEILDIVVELRAYPQTDLNGQFQLLNKYGDVLSTHSYLGNAMLHPSGIAWGIRNVGFDFSLVQMSIRDTTVNPGNTSYPSGGMVTKTKMSQARPNLRTVTGSCLLGLNDANNYAHKGFLVPVGGLLTRTDSSALIGYKYDITPPIPKSNTQTLRYRFELSWGRYEPT